MQRPDFQRCMVWNNDVALRRSGVCHPDVAARLTNLGKSQALQQTHEVPGPDVARQLHHQAATGFTAIVSSRVVSSSRRISLGLASLSP